ncbi:hypothetical protein MLD38_027632 [Melastoma candidum]|uniref:Uncharacterized protein n=1 Tax=Melastoma candidum TaxID=119954 RepID=A0ACB9P5J0_9MYRT|nr:hypothetical protein MLD38_027632 [Melastoma candidum]
MANSRIARFVMEVAPPQFVCIMRHRTSNMLETIREEEREAGPNESRYSLSPRTATSSSSPPAPSAAQDAGEVNPAR